MAAGDMSNALPVRKEFSSIPVETISSPTYTPKVIGGDKRLLNTFARLVKQQPLLKPDNTRQGS